MRLNPEATPVHRWEYRTLITDNAINCEAVRRRGHKAGMCFVAPERHTTKVQLNVQSICDPEIAERNNIVVGANKGCDVSLKEVWCHHRNNNQLDNNEKAKQDDDGHGDPCTQVVTDG